MKKIFESEYVNKENARLYYSVSMRLAYLSRNRSNLLILGKELAKKLKNPIQAYMQMLKHKAHYLRSHPRLLHLFPIQSLFT